MLDSQTADIEFIEDAAFLGLALEMHAMLALSHVLPMGFPKFLSSCVYRHIE